MILKKGKTMIRFVVVEILSAYTLLYGVHPSPVCDRRRTLHGNRTSAVARRRLRSNVSSSCSAGDRWCLGVQCRYFVRADLRRVVRRSDVNETVLGHCRGLWTACEPCLRRRLLRHLLLPPTSVPARYSEAPLFRKL